MTALALGVLGVAVEAHAAVPTLRFDLSIAETTGARVQSIDLRCQIRIEPERRRYDDAEAARLLDVFGERSRWADTRKPFLWTHASTMVRGFTGSTDAALMVECTYDLQVAAARYLHALRDGDIPLLLLFSGSVFCHTRQGGMQVEQIPWDREARFRLPVGTWRALMDAYYPDSGWLRLRRDTLDALGAYKSRHALATWDAAIDALLADAGHGVVREGSLEPAADAPGEVGP